MCLLKEKTQVISLFYPFTSGYTAELLGLLRAALTLDQSKACSFGLCCKLTMKHLISVKYITVVIFFLSFTILDSEFSFNTGRLLSAS